MHPPYYCRASSSPAHAIFSKATRIGCPSPPQQPEVPEPEMLFCSEAKVLSFSYRRRCAATVPAFPAV